jgi:hypothetical protein
VIRFERVQTGRWRWSYEERGKKLALVSNEDYGDLDEARAAAAAAYPAAEMEEPGRGSKARTRARSEPATKGVAEKIARWLTPVVILIAWSRRRD